MKKKPNRKVLRADQRAIDRLVELFVFVNNINRTPDLALRGGVYKEIAQADVFTASFDGWEVGYKLEDHTLFLTRKVFLKCEQPFSEIPDDQRNPIMAAVLEVFCERGQDIPQVAQISPFAILIEQNVMPLLLTEKNPNLVSKGPLISKAKNN